MNTIKHVIQLCPCKREQPIAIFPVISTYSVLQHRIVLSISQWHEVVAEYYVVFIWKLISDSSPMKQKKSDFPQINPTQSNSHCYYCTATSFTPKTWKHVKTFLKILFSFFHISKQRQRHFKWLKFEYNPTPIVNIILHHLSKRSQEVIPDCRCICHTIPKRYYATLFCLLNLQIYDQ